ncbi:NADP-dependent isocitrate dehydrogenase [Glutamicibacter mishrai]|uniref:Isocitrate dehydrogenase [NADP] n=1 Tax=Glutamicibacter mishrai TaxID=1775880 RepID=A0A6H0SJG1_9MICC|nr:NADP-dependent isocitrate dehydrogenase [Glutamicibacter mishrai]QIV87266.1 NADP-dependent isocitrate dehydrogenase [Glutamicibacter mishrai]
MNHAKKPGVIVEIRGDEAANEMFTMVRERIIKPLVDVDIQSFDLSLANRDATADAITVQAAAAVKEHRVAVKCSTITPTAAQVASFGLSQRWKSPNATLRKALDGVIFREPIVLESVPRIVPGWKAPIVVARHANADQYQATDFKVPGAGSLTLSFTPADGSGPIVREVTTFGADGGVALGMYNNTDSIRAFARACFRQALRLKLPLYFSTKHTVLKEYDGVFVEAFQGIYQGEFAQLFAEAGLSYEHRLIDDMVAFAIKSPGGFMWALKNYDGDVQADIVAQGFGSPGLMASVLAGEDGETCLFEAAHGTVARHYKRLVQGEELRANPVATIAAWSRALEHRGTLDSNAELVQAAEAIDAAVRGTVADGVMTADLAGLAGGHPVGTAQFIDAVAGKLGMTGAGR